MTVTDEIKDRLDVVSIIGSTVQLKRTGKNYKGLCPFHDEKTPSFIVFPDTGTWRCFGCGRGGDVFSFVMEREGWDFPETLRHLAQIAGVQLESINPHQQELRDKKELCYRVLEDAADFFTRNLLESYDAEDARTYVEERGLSLDTVRKFGVGFAPDSWDSTSNYLIQLGHSPEIIADAGMLVIRDDGHTYDRFRNRLTIAIKDLRGRVVGFGARGLAADSQPKYINSPQSDIFDKSQILFGFSEARRSIRESDTVIIVEGYMDVMQAHQAGFDNVVAQMGTALTESQLNQLARYTNRLILALDPDTAGQMATARGHEVIDRVTRGAAREAANEGVWNFDEAEDEYRAKLSPEIGPDGIVRYKTRTGFDIRVVILPQGKDPDRLIKESPGEWASLVQDATPIIDYVIQQTIRDRNLADPSVKVEVAERIMPLINELANPVERTHYRQYLARLLKVDERTFFPEISRQSSSQRSRSSRSQQSPRNRTARISDKAVIPAGQSFVRETYCLAVLLQRPEMLYEYNRVLGEIFGVERYQGADQPDWEVLPDFLVSYLMPGDFSDLQNRIIFELWNAALAQEEYDPLEYLRYYLDNGTLSYLDQLMTRPLAAIGREGQAVMISHTEDTLREKTLMTLLAMRESRIDQALREITFLLQDEGLVETEPRLKKQILLLMDLRKRITEVYRRLTGRNQEKMDN